MSFAYIRLSRWELGGFRLLGPGLGNLLFPWARAIKATHSHSLTPIWPSWPQIKIGTIIRGERDPRFYSGLFRNPGNYVSGINKLSLLAHRRKIGEALLEREKNVGGIADRSTIVVFEGVGQLFEPLVGHSGLITRELLRMTRPEHLAGLSHDFGKSITVHVRRGDFAPPNDSLLRAGRPNIRLPLSWVVETIVILRAALGADWRVWVFSDAHEDELEDLLRLPLVTRLHFGSSLADMLAMSCSTVLIPSSTFSFWSAFLGSAPCIYYPGQVQRGLYKGAGLGEIARAPGAGLPNAFFDTVRLHERYRAACQ